MTQHTKEWALRAFETKWWEKESDIDVALYQMEQDILCMPFDIFQETVKRVLGRPVWTHEFALNHDGIIKELQPIKFGAKEE